jgi:hypothetical protein
MPSDIDDDIGGPFGFAAGFGAPVVSAWFNEIASAPIYQHGWTYQDGHYPQQVLYGRPSAMVNASNVGDTIYNVSPEPPAQTLWNFWLY